MSELEKSEQNSEQNQMWPLETLWDMFNMIEGKREKKTPTKFCLGVKKRENFLETNGTNFSSLGNSISMY